MSEGNIVFVQIFENEIMMGNANAKNPKSVEILLCLYVCVCVCVNKFVTTFQPERLNGSRPNLGRWYNSQIRRVEKVLEVIDPQGRGAAIQHFLKFFNFSAKTNLNEMKFGVVTVIMILNKIVYQVTTQPHGL